MKLLHLYEADDSSIEFINTSRDFHHGQHDLTLWAKVNNKRVGKIDYSVYEDEPQIQMIEVAPSYRGKGIASQLLYELQRKYPDVEIDWGSLTTDGVGLRKSINFIKKPSEYFDEFKQLRKYQNQVKEYETIIADNWATGGEQPDIVKSTMERSYDLDYEISSLEHHLYGKSPYIRLMIPRGMK